MRALWNSLAKWFASSFSKGAASPSQNVKAEKAVLYQPEPVLAQRVSSVPALAEYMKQVEALVREAFKDSTTPEMLDVVLILKPGGKARAWLVSSLSKPPDRSQLIERIQKIPTLFVREGPFAFAICTSIAGAQRASHATPGPYLPLPEEWRAAAQDSAEPLSIPDGIIDKVWKD
jgi:hypothetical protein